LDPHGDPIPAADGSVERPDAVLLSELPAGSTVRVERISDADPQLLTFFAERGIGMGTVLDVRPGTPFSDAVEVAVSGAQECLTLGRFSSGAVWVLFAPGTPSGADAL